MRVALPICLAATLFAGVAAAQTCGTLPTTLTNGTIADATEVMDNFEALRTCINAAGTVSAGIAGQIGYYAATGSAVAGTSLSALLDAAIGTSHGAIIYRGASGWSLLAPGTSGYVLQTNGSGSDPTWVAQTGGGGGISTIVGAGVSSSSSSVALPAVPVISRPALSSLSWVNQASATGVEHTNGPLVLSTYQNTGSVNGINALVKSVAGTDWTVTIQYAMGHHLGTSADISGLIVYNSGDQKMYVAGLGGTGTINVWRYDNPTAVPVTNVAAKGVFIYPTSVWTRAKYTSSTTTLTFSYSIDGFTWEVLFTTSAPHTGVATSYGISVGTKFNAAGYVLSLNHLAESSP